MIEISTEWEKSDAGRSVQFYRLNGRRVGRRLLQVHKAIRARAPIPTKIIKKACLLAKEDEMVVRVGLSPLSENWIVRMNGSIQN